MTLVPLMVGFGTQEGRGTAASVKTLVSTGSTFFNDLQTFKTKCFKPEDLFSSQICMHTFLMCTYSALFLLSQILIFLSLSFKLAQSDPAVRWSVSLRLSMRHLFLDLSSNPQFCRKPYQKVTKAEHFIPFRLLTI